MMTEGTKRMGLWVLLVGRMIDGVEWALDLNLEFEVEVEWKPLALLE